MAYRSKVSRREFARVCAGFMAASPWLTYSHAAESRSGMQLPKGSSPPALGPQPFPNAVFALIWRNWSLVPTKTIAAVLQASRANVLLAGQMMGLDKPPTIREEHLRRSAITIIRRNWHLLPYDQLLQLLGWTAERLDFELREDDFLYVKLGSLKPACAPVRWSQPSEHDLHHCREIAAIVRAHFGGSGWQRGVDLFSFVEKLSKANPVRKQAKVDGSLRLGYSYFALYGDPLLDPSLDPYPAGYLARVSQAGLTAVWLHVVLAQLVDLPWERDPKAAERRQSLHRLVKRAAEHGIEVFLYLNEPRAKPARFFEEHSQWKGAVQGDFRALCTSVPEVREALAEGIAIICREIPKLGGFFSITASENFTNCWSHHSGQSCPRCRGRQPHEVIAELNGTFAEGIRRAKGKQRLIVWDWGWNDAWMEQAISLLPSNVSYMSVSEWNLPIERGGVRSAIGEYCLSAVGPGPRARQGWAAARKRGLTPVAKIQAAITWELSAVPYLPVLQNVAEHVTNLRAESVENLMISWTLGGGPSPNLEVVREIQEGGSLESWARRKHGDLADAALAFYRACSLAFREFPYHGGCVYQAPFQMGPANPIWLKRTGYASTMVGLPYDDLNGWRSIYPAEIWINQLEKVAEGFFNAVINIRSMQRLLPPSLQEEVTFAEVAGLHWQSAANQARFVLVRDKRLKGKSDEKQVLVDLLDRETKLARRLYDLQSADARIGFEATNQYYYVPQDLAEKVILCQRLKQEIQAEP